MEHFSTEHMAAFRPIEEYKPLPDFDPVKMLTSKRQKMTPTEPSIDFSTITQYDQSDVEALESFCKVHGILAASFGNMNPRNILRMLKSRVGITETKSNRGLLNG